MEYKIIRSKRKTVSISIDKNGEVVARAGYTCPKVFIDNFVLKNQKWIQNQLSLYQEKKLSEKVFSAEEIKSLKKKAKQILTEKTHFYSKTMQLSPQNIKITSAKTRWGSCSYKNNICYSYRVILLPEQCQDYIVVHELAHIKEKNHSANFYNLIKQYLPNYKILQQEIKNLKIQ